MNRIPIRGVGTAAAAVAATALAVGTHVPAADAQEPSTHASRASTLTFELMATNDNSVFLFPAQAPAGSTSLPSAAELALLHTARSEQFAALSALQAKSLAASLQLAALQKASDRASRVLAAIRATRSAPSRPVYSGSARAVGEKMAAARGWSGAQWQCLDSLWTRESGWAVTAQNGSGAYGIPQASPGSKMASVASDWRTDPATQIAWGLEYIAYSYGNPCGAWSFWQAHYWY